MAQRKPCNPNTKYGRRKLNEAHYQRMAAKTPEERSEVNDRAGLIFFVFIIVFGSIIFALFGFDGLIRWLGGKAPA